MGLIILVHKHHDSVVMACYVLGQQYHLCVTFGPQKMQKEWVCGTPWDNLRRDYEETKDLHTLVSGERWKRFPEKMRDFISDTVEDMIKKGMI